jgi:hypothetical protein
LQGTWCGNGKRYKTLDELSEDFLVEFHADKPDRAHISGYTEKPLIAKSSDAGKFKSKIEANEIPAIEIKSEGKDGISFSPPSYHNHGHPYEGFFFNENKKKMLCYS